MISRFLVAFTLVHLLCGQAFAQTRLERKPNIIFILADDLGYGDLGCYGQTKIRTPNVDRLAAEGIRFTQHYSGSPVCAPSRCVMMTGKHPGHAYIRDNRGVKPEGQFPLTKESVTLAELLQASGYQTGAFGKWGLGPVGSSGDPLTQGFNRFYGYNCQSVAHDLYPTHLWDDSKHIRLRNPSSHKPKKLPEGTDPKDPASYEIYFGQDYAPDLYSEQALRFIRDNRERPFFLYYPTIIPHLALQVPEDSLSEYEGKLEDRPYVGGNGYLPHRTPHAAYAAMISRMDREVGRMVDLIKELKLENETLFIFTSDNGPAPQGLGGTDSEFFNSNGPLRGGKTEIYEGGIRVPLIVRWKGRIAPGTTSDRVTGFEDWLPTLLELVGEKKRVPEGLDGISFARTLLGLGQLERPFLYREFPGYQGQQAIRVGDWKAVRRQLKPKGAAEPNLEIELYNLKRDIGESKNLAAERPKIVARLSKLMSEQHVPSREFPLPALDNLANK